MTNSEKILIGILILVNLFIFHQQSKIQKVNLGAPTSFIIATSTGNITSTFANGTATTTIQAASSTFAGRVNIRGLLNIFGGINASSTATSTFQNGINTATGCFSINGVCLPNEVGAKFAWTPRFDGNATTTRVLFDNGLISSASSTFSSLLVAGGGLNSSSTATSTFANGIELFGGCFKTTDGTCLQGGGLTSFSVINETGSVTLTSVTSSGAVTLTSKASTSPTFHSVIATSSLGVGTSTPARTLSVQGDSVVSGTSSVASLVATGSVQALQVDSTIYTIANATVLTSNTLGSGILASSLTSVGTLSSLTISGNLTVDTNSLFVDSSANRVGIGTSTPGALFSAQGNGLLSGNLLSSGLIATGTVNFSCSTQSTKSVFVETVSTSTTITLLQVERASTISKVKAVTQCDGACQGGVVFNLYHGTSRATSSATALFTDNAAVNSTTTGKTFSTFNDNTLAANEWLSLYFQDGSTTPITDANVTLCIETS